MAGNQESRGAQEPKRRRKMLALKLLLTVAGVLMLAAAVAIPLYSLWLRIRLARIKAAGAAAGCLPAAADRGQHCRSAQWNGRRARLADSRHSARNALSGHALHYP